MKTLRPFLLLIPFTLFTTSLFAQGGLECDSATPPVEGINFADNNEFADQCYTYTAATDVFDMMGRKVKVLVHENSDPGTYDLILKQENMKSGVYYVILTSGDGRTVKKIVKQ